MKTVEWGQKLTKQYTSKIRLKDSGDKILFRLLGKPVLEGNHFFNVDGKWDVKSCPRINDDSNCQYCDKFEEARKAMPRIKDPKEYRTKIDELKKSMPGFEASITYNFPILDRETGVQATFQATPGLRNKIDSEGLALGSKIFNYDFIAMNTGKAGKEKYSLTRVDSAETAPLTEEEKKWVAGFNPDDFSISLGGTPEEDSGMSRASEEVEVSDIPF